MKVVVQRVSQASLLINNIEHCTIGNGLVVFLGIASTDTKIDADWLCHKISSLRIFNDEDGLMNRSILDINGSMLLVSQFTLIAAYKKGNRPSFINAARPEQAISLYQYCIQKLSELLEQTIYTGVFGADMQVSLTNDGPVTIIMDSQNKE